VIPLSPSLDHCGPLAKTVEDSAIMLGMKAPGQGVTNMRIGVPRSYFFERIDPEVHDAVQHALRVLERLGARLVEVDFPSAPLQQEVFSRIAGLEAFAYHRSLIERHRAEYGADVLARIEAGASVSEAAHLEAQAKRRAMKVEHEQAFETADVIATPTTPVTAPLIDQTEVQWPGQSEPVPSALTRYTRWFNLVGAPAISVPCGFTRQGLPVGFQIGGRVDDDATVLRCAATYERATSRRG
jgi:aspartyl-tRNA(Asn)/glutamyl-tRNA(Gln) amidotransferase subunit A